MTAAKKRIASSKSPTKDELTKNKESRCVANTTGGNAVGDTLHGIFFSAKNISVSELEREPPSKSNPGTHEECLLLILMRARGLCADLRNELERTNQDNNELCLLLSNCADDLDGFISGMGWLQETKS